MLGGTLYRQKFCTMTALDKEAAEESDTRFFNAHQPTRLAKLYPGNTIMPLARRAKKTHREHGSLTNSGASRNQFTDDQNPVSDGRYADGGSGVNAGNVRGMSAARLPTPPFSIQPCAPHIPLVGRSTAILQLNAIIERVASLDSSVLITGATGTGKELVARAMHQCSRRSPGPFIDINCSAIPDTLFEAEVFGHQRGSFTGAHETRRGLFESASGGTLFLDEVDALSLAAQAKLLRVLQERRLRRVGGRDNITIDVRVVAATNRDLHAAVEQGTFRPDLFFRLRVVPVQVPELRERIEDVELLAEHFLRRHAQAGHVPARGFTDEATRALLSYPWPGNVRELENAVEYALAIGRHTQLGVEDLPPEVGRGQANAGGLIDHCLTAGASLAEVERRYILLMFERHGRRRSRTASALCIDRRTLYRKLKEYGVADEGEEASED